MNLLEATGIAGMDGRMGFADTRKYVHTFFDIYLRGSSKGTFYQTPLIPAARFERK